jgi:hypothetical protein
LWLACLLLLLLLLLGFLLCFRLLRSIRAYASRMVEVTAVYQEAIEAIWAAGGSVCRKAAGVQGLHDQPDLQLQFNLACNAVAAKPDGCREDAQRFPDAPTGWT